ncbi:MAG TPA: HAMP domain-containing sensor histidine kinase, partial [Thermoleophilia bacterium]|nr:HAMP domain-containing sensor histidine kinase [Thermoleophilia bacterium]
TVASATTPVALYDLTRQYLTGPQSEALGQRGLILSLRLSDGAVVSNSSTLRLEELPVSQPLIANGSRILATVDSPAGPYRVAGTPVVQGQERVGVVEVAASLQGMRNTLRRVLVLFSAAGLVGIALTGLGFWLLVGWALSPVRRISRTAAAISREDLTRRIGHKGPHDEIGELAETMDAMLDRLQQAFEAQERFISDVSHELRTPLTIIKGHLQVLDRVESLDKDQVGQEHALVLDEIDRLNRLVGDLLTIARATRVDFLRKETVPLDQFLSTLVEQGPHLGDRTWKIEELPGGAVFADQDRLTQVFLNLMQNAVAHTEPGQVIAVGGSREDGHVRLWVRDEGRGMSPEVEAHVFERFYRGQGSDTPGMGLGLAIVRALVGAHSGEVSVDSALGAGTTFIVRLPT